MEQPEITPTVALRRLVDGYQVSQAIHIAATLGIADLLTDGPRTSDDLAAATDSDPRALYRLLRALASVDVLREEEGRRFSLTPLGDCLRSDAPEPVGGWAAYIDRPYYWQVWADLLHTVKTGENAFRHLHGMDVWEYRSSRPEENAIFNGAMTALAPRHRIGAGDVRLRAVPPRRGCRRRAGGAAGGAAGAVPGDAGDPL